MEHKAGAGRRKAPMQRAHKIRLNPTPQQTEYLRKACGTARFAFNWGLAEWQKQYAAGEKPSAYTLKKQFNAIKREQFPWVLDVSKCAVDTGFRNLDAAFKSFFRRCKNGDTKKGYPNFKSKKRSKLSFRMDGTRVSVDGHWLKLERLDEPINMAEVLRFDGEIKSVTISEDAGHWYAAINVEIEPPEHKHPQGSVGIDVGVKTLAVLSDGTRYENQVLLRSETEKVKASEPRIIPPTRGKRSLELHQEEVGDATSPDSRQAIGLPAQDDDRDCPHLSDYRRGRFECRRNAAQPPPGSVNL
jgi:putative transposase